MQCQVCQLIKFKRENIWLNLGDTDYSNTLIYLKKKSFKTPLGL